MDQTVNPIDMNDINVVQDIPNGEITYDAGVLRANFLGSGDLTFSHSNLDPVSVTVAAVPSESVGLQSFNELNYDDEGDTTRELVLHIARYNDETQFIYIREYNLQGADRSALYHTKIINDQEALNYSSPHKIMDLDDQFEIDPRFLGLEDGKYFDLYDGHRKSQEYFFYGRRMAGANETFEINVFDFSDQTLRSRVFNSENIIDDEDTHIFYDSRGYLIIFKWRNLGNDDSGNPKDGEYISALPMNIGSGRGGRAVESLEISYNSTVKIDRNTIFINRDNEMFPIPKEIPAQFGGMVDIMRTVKINPQSTNTTFGGLETGNLEIGVRLEGQMQSEGRFYNLLNVDMVGPNEWNLISMISFSGIPHMGHAMSLQRIRGSNGFPKFVPTDDELRTIPGIKTESIFSWESAIYGSLHSPEKNKKYVYRQNSDDFVVWEFDISNPNNGWQETLNENLPDKTSRLNRLGVDIFNNNLKKGPDEIPYLLTPGAIYVKYSDEDWQSPESWRYNNADELRYLATHNAFLFSRSFNQVGLPDLYFRYAF